MAAAVAGTGAGRGAPGIHARGRDGAAAGDADGFRRAARLTEEAGAGRAVAEAAGRMRRALPQPLRAGGIDVCVTDPGRPWDFARAGGGPAKTGRADAGAPAALGAAFPDMAPSAPAAAGRLRGMPALRERPVDRRAQLKAVLPETGGADGPVPEVPAATGSAVRDYDRRTGEPAAGPERFAGSRAVLAPAPGIGPVTAAAPVAWTGGPGASGARPKGAVGNKPNNSF